MRVLSNREVASVEPEGSELFSAEFAQMRLFTELPPVAPLASEFGIAKQRLQRTLRRNHLELEYTIENAMAPAELPPKFEYYSTETRVPRIGEVFHARVGQPATCILFNWTPMPTDGVKYIVEVGKSRKFSFFRSFGVSSNRIQLRASKNSDYFWRVRATHKGHASLSDVGRFTVVVPPDTSPDGKRREIASRMAMPEAWLSDVQICP